MAVKFTAADMTGTSEGGSAAASSNKKIVSDVSGNSELPISEGAELPQIQRHAVDTEQFLGLSRTCVKFVFYVFLSLAAAYLLIDGVCLMYGAPKEADILGFAVLIGKKLIGSTPFLGVVMVLFMLLKAIQTSKVTKAKVLIISWLIVCLILGVSLPFAEVKVAAIKDKATAMYFGLVAVLALAVQTNLHEMDDL